MEKYIDFGDNYLCTLSKKALRKELRAIKTECTHGFKCTNTFSTEGNPNSKYTNFEFWKLCASEGFFDSQNCLDQWDMPYLNRVPDLNFDFTHGKPQIESWDQYLLYGVSFGSWVHQLEHLLENSNIRHRIRTVVEPMCSSAELSYFGHMRYPGLNFYMFDLDEQVTDRLKNKRWVSDRVEIRNADALNPKAWNVFDKEGSVCFIGKQSLNYFNPNQVMKLVTLISNSCEYLLLESMEYSGSIYRDLSDEYINEPVFRGSKYTTRIVYNGGSRLDYSLDFSLVLSDGKKDRTLFYYPWRLYSNSELIHFFETTNRIDSVSLFDGKLTDSSNVKYSSISRNTPTQMLIKFK